MNIKTDESRMEEHMFGLEGVFEDLNGKDKNEAKFQQLFQFLDLITSLKIS
jgi:hypothetical protein